jgi:Tfp pilus assembly protein PilV
MKPGPRAGLSLVELTVALTFLGVVLTSIAGLTVEAAQRAQALSGQSRRQAAVTEEVNRLTALPWASLAPTSSTGICRTHNDPGFQHTRCVTVTAVTTFVRQVRLIVTPAQLGVRPDTVMFTRANPPTLNPLMMP